MKDRLHPLLKSCEASEHRAVQEFSRVETVADERQKVVKQLRSRHDGIAQQLDELRTKKQTGALCSGDLSAVTSFASYARRLEKQLKKTQQLLAEREKELAQAQQRLQLAERDLAEARIEKKKIEKLIANRALDFGRKEAAREEIVTDELSELMRRK